LVLLKGAIAAIGTMTTGPIGLLILAITGIIAVWKNWDEIVAFVLDWKDKIIGYLTDLKDIATQKIQEMIDKIILVFDDIKNLPNEVLQWGKDIVQGLINGINAAWQNFVDFIKEKLGVFASFFTGGSPPKHGPLKDYDKWFKWMVESFVDQIEDGTMSIEEAMQGIAEAVSTKMDKINEDAKAKATIFSNIFEGLKTTLKNNFIDPVIGMLEDELYNAIHAALTPGEEYVFSWKTFWTNLKNSLISAISAMLAKLIPLLVVMGVLGMLGVSWSTILNIVSWLGVKGGEAEYYQEGGARGTDIIPAWLTPGEYVISKEMTNFIKRFRAIPQNLVEAIAGGFPTPTPAIPAFAGGGLVGNINSNINNSAIGFGETKIYVDIHDNKIDSDIDIRKLATNVSDEILRKISINRRY